MIGGLFTRKVLGESFRLLGRWERALFVLAAVTFAASAVVLVARYVSLHTAVVPASGGFYTEAIVGGPRFINPALAPANDTDRDLVKLVYSGLLKYDALGQLVPDLAESYLVSTDSKTLIFTLRENATWHDGRPVSTDDVAFTIHLIQNAEYQSPLRLSWQGVRVEKKDDRTIQFTLAAPYAVFPAYATLGILPRHIWQDIPPQAFALEERNLKPIGSGPFRFKSLEREKDGSVTSLTLDRHKNFYDKVAYLEQLTFLFFESREDALAALSGGEADGIGGLSPADVGALPGSGIPMHTLSLPRTFSVFFNPNQSSILSQKVVREALDFATDRQSIVREVYDGNAETLYGPLPQSVFGYTDGVTKREYDAEKAAALLEKAGWKLQPDGTRLVKETKKEERQVGNRKVMQEVATTTTLEFSLLTANLPELEKTTELLKAQWEGVGARVNVEVAGVADIQGERVRPRLYDAVLFGEVLGLDPDPYSFWHSSQRRDPGLNLALYKNPKVDKLLEEMRQTADPAERKKKLSDFQKIVSEDVPAIFLYSPQYLYAVSSRIRHVGAEVIANPAERFGDVAEWYVKTKRVWR